MCPANIRTSLPRRNIHFTTCCHAFISLNNVIFFNNQSLSSFYQDLAAWPFVLSLREVMPEKQSPSVFIHIHTLPQGPQTGPPTRLSLEISADCRGGRAGQKKTFQSPSHVAQLRPATLVISSSQPCQGAVLLPYLSADPGLA